jgi:hypothetical protein
MDKHCVKGKTRAQLMEQISEQFGRRSHILCGDFASMESNIDHRSQLTVEAELMEACAPSRMKRMVAEYYRFFSSCQLYASSVNYVLVMPHIRLSGTEQTSVGNHQSCSVWILSMLAEYYGLSPDSVRQLNFPFGTVEFNFEGDDSIMAVPEAVDVEELKAIGERMGCRIEFEQVSDFRDGKYCGVQCAESVEAVPGPRLGSGFIKDPIAVLQRLVCLFRPPSLDSSKHYLELQVAKVRSALQEYPGLPIVSVFCTEYLRRFSGPLAHVQMSARRFVTDHVGNVPFVQLLKEMSHGEPLEVVAANLALELPPVSISQRVREKVAAVYHIGVALQQQVEDEIRSSFAGLDMSKGRWELVMPILEGVCDRYVAMRRMVRQPLGDARRIAHDMAVRIGLTQGGKHPDLSDMYRRMVAGAQQVLGVWKGAFVGLTRILSSVWAGLSMMTSPALLWFWGIQLIHLVYLAIAVVGSFLVVVPLVGFFIGLCIWAFPHGAQWRKEHSFAGCVAYGCRVMCVTWLCVWAYCIGTCMVAVYRAVRRGCGFVRYLRTLGKEWFAEVRGRQEDSDDSELDEDSGDESWG